MARSSAEGPGRELTSLRRKTGLSQAVFAGVLNVSTKTVQSWEQGTGRPSQVALRLIQVFRQNPSGVLQAAGMTGLAETRTNQG
jgi:putative transcriptional regulator